VILFDGGSASPKAKDGVFVSQRLIFRVGQNEEK
jgi:hypothetical protein